VVENSVHAGEFRARADFQIRRKVTPGNSKKGPKYSLFFRKPRFFGEKPPEIPRARAATPPKSRKSAEIFTFAA
jgi:hypothetical protein